MHQFIFGKTRKSCVIDHINGNSLDNTRKNLREATLQQQAQTAQMAELRKQQRPGFGGSPQAAVATAEAAQSAQAMANPTTQNYMQRMSALAGRYAPVIKGAGVIGAGLGLAHSMLSTSDEEIAALKRQEAARRAQGWRPINER